MMKLVLLEVDTEMANRELAEWITRTVEKQNEADPARRQVVLAQKPHVQAVQGKIKEKS